MCTNYSRLLTICFKFLVCFFVDLKKVCVFVNNRLVLKVLRLEGKRWSEGEEDNLSGAGSKLNLTTSSESDADEQLRLSSSDLLS